MTKFLIDSDVIIWHLRGRREIAELLKNLQKAGVPACSSLSIVEVQQGVKPGEEKKTDAFLNSLTVYPVDRKIATEAGRCIRGYKKRGIVLGIPDAVIAATCLVYNLVLLTYNQVHYPMPELKLYPL